MATDVLIQVLDPPWYSAMNYYLAIEIGELKIITYIFWLLLITETPQPNYFHCRAN